ncbi:MAG TPA: branched-chain amino acid ABC transporter permease [Actinomycetota bacterium]|nr:branched-chain amino acid ABC transporter permease [Actinomycetota bacterium]
MATSTAEATAAVRRRPAAGGLAARGAVASVLVIVVLLIPVVLPSFRASQATRAVIFAIIGLSLNVLLGHLGQISLGHQAFVGMGAFASGLMVGKGIPFFLALPLAGVIGALAAAILGLVALRIRGLYLALVTLAFGFVAEESIFNVNALTRGGEGMPAPRPPGFLSDPAYMYLCLIVLAVVLLMDWRLVKTKGGRAIMAIRHDERVAATLGVNVTFYKLFAFMLSGFLAGIAGSLFAHWITNIATNDFVLDLALVWVFMTVVGGLGSRAGIVIAATFFALLPILLEAIFPLLQLLPFINADMQGRLPRIVPVIGALLLVLTLTLYPGGIGQQLLPIRRWLAGGPFRDPLKHGRKHASRPAKRRRRRGSPPTPAGDGAATTTPTEAIVDAPGPAEAASAVAEAARATRPTGDGGA